MYRLLLILLFLLIFSSSAMAQEDHEKTVQLPPDSLAQWYKPANKRQVWLHNMFKLRREMQAVMEYIALEEPDLVKKWAERLVIHYRKIAEMVPEWEEELSLDWAENLEAAAVSGDFDLVKRAARKLGQSCKSCHREYRAVVAVMLRAPDFSGIKIKRNADGVEQSYAESMKELTVLVNRIKIAAEDERRQVALDAVAALQLRLNELGESCASCHKGEESRERFVGKKTADVLSLLSSSISDNDKKSIGRHLGTAAVITCARCHSVHRSTYDLKQMLAK